MSGRMETDIRFQFDTLDMHYLDLNEITSKKTEK